MTTRASIVVSTLDREAYLAILLSSLERLDHPAFEVVIVNGPSRDQTEALLARWQGRIKAIRCPVANLSRSRNLGITAAAGEIVAFIDDDAVPAAPEWLSGLCAPFADPRVGGAGGPVLARDGAAFEFEGRVVSEYGELFPPFEAARRGVTVDGTGRVPGVQGANCAFRRDALLGVGGFDERFVYVFDETDVCMRVARGGWTIAYAPRSAVVHESASSSRRRSAHDRDWWTIAQADAYFALKNARAPLPRRIVETIRRARGKWPYWQINAGYNEGRYGLGTRLIYLTRWAGGLATGLWLGVASPRRMPLGPATPPPPPFVPFR